MPIYRYKCTECRHEIEIHKEFSEIPDGMPAELPKMCQVLIPKLLPVTDIEWIDENDVPRSCPSPTEYHCRGKMKRVYDDFQFHISGR